MEGDEKKQDCDCKDLVLFGVTDRGQWKYQCTLCYDQYELRERLDKGEPQKMKPVPPPPRFIKESET